MGRATGNERERIGDLAPANNLAAITVSDTVDIETGWTRAIYVGTGGDVNILAAEDDAEVLLKAVPTGTILPIIAKRVFDTSTTADDLVALY